MISSSYTNLLSPFKGKAPETKTKTSPFAIAIKPGSSDSVSFSGKSYTEEKFNEVFKDLCKAEHFPLYEKEFLIIVDKLNQLLKKIHRNEITPDEASYIAGQISERYGYENAEGIKADTVLRIRRAVKSYEDYLTLCHESRGSDAQINIYENWRKIDFNDEYYCRYPALNLIKRAFDVLKTSVETDARETALCILCEAKDMNKLQFNFLIRNGIKTYLDFIASDNNSDYSRKKAEELIRFGVK